MRRAIYRGILFAGGLFRGLLFTRGTAQAANTRHVRLEWSQPAAAFGWARPDAVALAWARPSVGALWEDK